MTRDPIIYRGKLQDKLNVLESYNRWGIEVGESVYRQELKILFTTKGLSRTCWSRYYLAQRNLCWVKEMEVKLVEVERSIKMGMSEENALRVGIFELFTMSTPH